MSTMSTLSFSARAVALQMLYALDGGAEYSLDGALPLLRSVLLSEGDECLASLDDFDDAVPLVRNVIESREALDETIRRHSRNWRLERMAQLDRNLLRLMLYLAQENPAGQSESVQSVQSVIDDAGELARSFGTAESVAFVTGLLERCLAK